MWTRYNKKQARYQRRFFVTHEPAERPCEVPCFWGFFLFLSSLWDWILQPLPSLSDPRRLPGLSIFSWMSFQLVCLEIRKGGVLKGRFEDLLGVFCCFFGLCLCFDFVLCVFRGVCVFDWSIFGGLLVFPLLISWDFKSGLGTRPQSMIQEHGGVVAEIL